MKIRNLKAPLGPSYSMLYVYSDFDFKRFLDDTEDNEVIVRKEVKYQCLVARIY